MTVLLPSHPRSSPQTKTNSDMVYHFLRLQEKSKKILDIWVKNNTFPSAALERLSQLLKNSEKGACRILYPTAKRSFRSCNSIFSAHVRSE